MRDDFFACLTREMKDEVMERYVTERRLIELQIEHLREQAEDLRACGIGTAKRLARLSYWMMNLEVREKLVKILGIAQVSAWREYLVQGCPYELHSIQVSALRDRTRLRQIITKAYQRAYNWMRDYNSAYENLKAACEAVNDNILTFQNNFELLTVLKFLKNLDTCHAEKSHFLGGNFTSEELASVDRKLRFKPVWMDSLEVLPPLPLPEPHLVDRPLTEIAHGIHVDYENQVKELIGIMGRKGY